MPVKMWRASARRICAARSFNALRLKAEDEIGSTPLVTSRSFSSKRISAWVRLRWFSSPIAQTISSWAWSGTRSIDESRPLGRCMVSPLRAMAA